MLASKNPYRPQYTLRARDFAIDLGQKTRVMGIINVTPDSFSGDGILAKAPGHQGTRAPKEKTTSKTCVETAVKQALRMVIDGADILDIGGESARPGSRRISVEEERQRIIPLIQTLAKTVKIPLSADTYKSAVARAALDSGASIINNIKGVRSEQSLLKMVRRYDAAVVLMHIQGTPRTMQKRIPLAKNIVAEIILALKISVENCLEIGIKSDKIIIDPGIGFGKTTEQNLEILHQLGKFQALGCPILVGTSRKSFIGKVLNLGEKERLAGTLATVTASILNGAHIIRAHDVKAAKETAQMTDAIIQQRIK